MMRTSELVWDNEKRKWPQRQHYAVLVAEHINRRFFNVIQLLSHAIPIIAIQVSLFALDGKKRLFFTTVLDTYEEIEVTPPESGIYDREDWVKKAKWTLDAADALLNVTSSTLREPVLNYLKNYVAITADGNNYMWLHKRTADKSLLISRIDQSLQDEAAAILDAGSVAHVRKPKTVRMVVDKDMIEKNAELFKKIAVLLPCRHRLEAMAPPASTEPCPHCRDWRLDAYCAPAEAGLPSGMPGHKNQNQPADALRYL
jgi:hypothetical protein